MNEEWTAAVSTERARREAESLVESFDSLSRTTARLQLAIGGALIAGAGFLAAAWTI